MLKPLAIILLSVVGALFAFFAALSNYAVKSNPALAMTMPGATGFAYASMSDQVLKTAVASQQLVPTLAQQKQIEALSIAAFEREPFAVNAIRNLGLVSDFRKNREKARQILNEASNLTSRDVSTNLWLVQDYGRLGNVKQMLVNYDRPLRHSGLARNALLPSLRDGLKNDEMIDPLAGLLAKNPPWATSFWSDMASNPASLKNAAALRIKLLSKNISYTVAADQYLVNALISADRLAEAEALYNKLVSRGPNGGDNVVRNSSFKFESEFFPFEWQLFSNEKFSVQILGKQERLSILGFGNERGMVARQLVRMPSGKYQLNAALEDSASSLENPLEVELRCASGVNTFASAKKIALDKAGFSVAVEFTGNCDFVWLELHLAAQPSNQDFDIEISSLSVTRL